MTKGKYRVEGMFCANCAKTITDNLNGVEGIEYINVDLAKNMAHVSFDETKISLQYIQKIVKRSGYNLVIDENKESKKDKVLKIITIVLCFAFLLFGILMTIAHIPNINHQYHMIFSNDILGIIIGSLALISLGFPYIKRAIKMIFSLHTGMDTLISLSALSAYILSLYLSISNLINGTMNVSYFDSLLYVLSIITLGHYLENKVKSLSGKKVKDDIKNDVSKVKIEYMGQISEVNSEQVLKDDIYICAKGDSLASDGIVISGSGKIDMSSLTGESKLIDVKEGSLVYAGTLLADGNLKIKSSDDAINSLQYKIENQAYVMSYSKGNLIKLSDKIATYFVPIVLVLSIITFFVNFFTPLHSYIPLNDVSDDRTIVSITRAISILVVSCPCAFGLAVPLVSLNAYYNALKHNIVFKTGDTFERVKNIKNVVFDKTGTLTTGEMEVKEFFGDEKYINTIKGIEQYSLHPIAKGILKYRQDIACVRIKNVKEIEGKGLENEKWYLGKIEDFSSIDKDFLNRNKNSTIIGLKDKDIDEFVAFISLKDVLQQDTKKVIDILKMMGINIYILSGDNLSSVEKIGDELGLEKDHIYASLLPQQKSEIIKELSKKGEITYVGDGINDMQALAIASLSIATYKAAPIAKNRADCLLLNESLASIPYAIRLSKGSYKIIIENFIWALVYNAVLIPLAAIGYLYMWMCALVMIISNITLIFNSLRVNKIK